LYVGDSKFGSIENRIYVVDNDDYYLLPLSLVQLSKIERVKTINEKLAKQEDLIEVYRIKQEEKELEASGFEQEVALEKRVINEKGEEEVLK